MGATAAIGEPLKRSIGPTSADNGYFLLSTHEYEVVDVITESQAPTHTHVTAFSTAALDRSRQPFAGVVVVCRSG